MNLPIRLSIIVPVYNVENYIEECLLSIIGQIKDSFPTEIIVVNDGSPDKSVDIVYRISQLHPGVIKIFNQENQGLSMARNNGLKEAVGEYVWFVDGDDYLLKYALEDISHAVDDNLDVDVFSSFLMYYYEKENTYRDTTETCQKIGTGKQYLFDKMPIGASVRFIFKRQFLLDKNLWFVPNILHEDGVFGYEMLYQAQKIYVLNNPVYVYRIRSAGSIMSSITIKTAYDLMSGHKYLVDYAERKVRPEDKDRYRECIFGMLVVILDFCKDLYGTNEYKEFVNTDGNGAYIFSEAKRIFRNNRTNLKALTIALNPAIFIGALKIRRFIRNIIKRWVV